MVLRWFLQPNAYYDSVKLMRVSETLTAQPGVLRAAVVMATPLNMELLARDGLAPPGVRGTPDDLLASVLGESEEAADSALASLQDLLRAREVSGVDATDVPAHTIEAAAGRDIANMAVVAVPGPNAAAEAFAALRSDLHVFLFSDNVPLEDEIRLKALASERDLLMMGPDCGTAIIGGVGLGFANRVQRGPVGIVGASGTGIQQLCCLLDEVHIGIAQAIGTGGRDLSAAVGGSMTRRALQLLDEDDTVELIAVISKAADAETAQALDVELRRLSKPIVACLLGTDLPASEQVQYAPTLTEAADAIAQRLSSEEEPDWHSFPTRLEGRRGNRVYGLFAGGTLMSEAAQVLDTMGVKHTLVDLGADEYTRGRAHPIIDPRLRASMLADLAGRTDMGVALLDVILGDLAHPDPAGALLPAIEVLRPTPTIAVLVGTRADPQGLAEQRAMLQKAGVEVLSSNVLAARVAGKHVGAAA